MPESADTNTDSQLDVSDIEKQFVNVAPLYDRLMTGVPYTDWLAYIRKLLNTRSVRPSQILDLACGTGNMSELFASEGYKVTGVDIASRMIEVAKQKTAKSGSNVSYIVQDAAELTLDFTEFDLCVSLFDSLNYITNPARLQMAMHRVFLHLRTGGLFIFDINSQFALKHRFFDQDNLKYPEEWLTYDWKSEYNASTRICRVNMDFWYKEDDGTRRAFKEVHVQFAYTQDEMVRMLTIAGFDEIDVFQAYTLNKPGRTADRLYFVARKP